VATPYRDAFRDTEIAVQLVDEVRAVCGEPSRYGAEHHRKRPSKGPWMTTCTAVDSERALIAEPSRACQLSGGVECTFIDSLPLLDVWSCPAAGCWLGGNARRLSDRVASGSPWGNDRRTRPWRHGGVDVELPNQRKEQTR